MSCSYVMAQDYSDVAASLLKNNERGIPTVKEFDYSFISTLDKRGEPKVYTRENSANFEYIGMPIGGIVTGQLYMGGDGQLWFWDIFNTSNKHGDYEGEEAYKYPYSRSDKSAKGVNDIFQGFAFRVDGKVWRLNRDGFKDISFRGEYPIAKVSYKDVVCPVEVELNAYSPFIPLDVENSSFPATIFKYTFTNTQQRDITIDIAGWLENSALFGSRKYMKGIVFKNEKFDLIGASGLNFSATNADIDVDSFYDYGDMTLMLVGSDVKANLNYYGSIDNLFNNSGNNVNRYSSEDWVSKYSGSVSTSITLAAGESKTVSYVMSWYYPNAAIAGGGRREYVNRFESSADVAKAVVEDFDNLTHSTELWNKTWYDSSLPYWFLDRTFVNTSILASQTCFMFEDGRFYGFEGGYQGTGTCTHVWGYEQAMVRLFPELECNLREKTDFAPYGDGGGFHLDRGMVNFRGKYNNKAAVDGQSSIIIRSLLAHKMMADNSFLEQNWANIKLTMEYLINNNDGNEDGILTGWQHNTLDSDWNGKVAWLSGYYQAALRACAIMARECGDESFARRCVAIADRGRVILERDLFNGDYFFQLPEEGGQKTVGIQNGCEYSQMLGQSQAYQVGLGEIHDPKKISTALDALWRYNFTTDVGPYRERNPAGRWYAMPGEGGLIACTWPNGGQEALENDSPRYAAYNHECQNGYEYAATSLMMWHGQPYRALAHTRIMEDERYDGAKRNPYCEVEWGLHYARSMASYGLFTAACGFDCDGPNGVLKFSPKIQQKDFKAPFVTAEGWGTYSQKEVQDGSSYRLDIVRGSLTLRSIYIPVLSHAKKVKCSINGVAYGMKSSLKGDNIIAKFDGVTLKEGDVLIITVN